MAPDSNAAGNKEIPDYSIAHLFADYGVECEVLGRLGTVSRSRAHRAAPVDRAAIGPTDNNSSKSTSIANGVVFKVDVHREPR